MVRVAQPGATLELQLAWQAVGPQEPAPSFATRLWDLQGTLISTADHLDSRALDGEVGFATLVHQIPVDRCSPVLVRHSGGLPSLRPGLRIWGLSHSRPLRATAPTPPCLPSGYGRAWSSMAGHSCAVSTTTSGATVRDRPTCTGADRSSCCSRTERHQTRGRGIGLGPMPDCQAADQRAGLTADRTFPTGRLVREAGVLPLPAPKPGERYMPFGANMVLVGEKLALGGKQDALLTLRWRTAAPQVDDYAVSTRLLDADGTWLLRDIQPGLGAIPTLKWVTRGDLVRDPHPFTEPGGSAPPCIHCCL